MFSYYSEEENCCKNQTLLSYAFLAKESRYFLKFTKVVYNTMSQLFAEYLIVYLNITLTFVDTDLNDFLL